VASPDQVVGRASVETLGFTSWSVNDHRPARRRLIAAVAAERSTLEATVLEGRPTGGTPLALRTTGTAFGAAAAAARTFKAGPIGSGPVGL
jgi:hypothetical protein